MYALKTLAGLFATLLLLLSACQKENNPFEKDPSDLPSYQEAARLKQILLYASAEAEDPICIVEAYEYDDQERINKVTSPMYEDGEICGTIKYDLYRYNSRGQLEQIQNYHANSNETSGFINLENHLFTYSADGKKEREDIEYPQIDAYEYKLFQYEDERLVRMEFYGNDGQLGYCLRYAYDHSGYLVTETKYGPEDQAWSITRHSYEKGLRVKSEVFGGKDLKEELREIRRIYDENGNLIYLDSKELSMFSSRSSFFYKYEYFE